MLGTILTNDVIVEQSNLTEKVHILRKKEIPVAERPKILVAAYCRVSTDREEQEKSLEHQMSSYRQIISEHPGWELAGIYADPGVTGTSVKNRKEFQRMIEDAKAGKIQRILAKSISRFARNTEDMLKYTRMLRSIGVGVYFEKEHIDTMQGTSEMLLTVYAAFSQEESHDIAENEKTNFRFRAQKGEAKFGKLYGYTSTKDEKWIIVPEEAEVVRRIFDLYNKCYTVREIVDILNSEGIPTCNDAEKGWSFSQISNLLQNEKYTGDFLIQKSYTEDFLTHKRKPNRDLAVPQYYLSDNHEGIVSKDVYEEAQAIAKLRGKRRGFFQYPYYGFLVCPCCGENLLACSLNTVSCPRAWFCPGHEADGKMTRAERTNCPPFVILESLLDEVVIKAILNLKDEDFDEETQKKLPLIKERLKKTGKVERYYLTTLVKRITLSGWRSVKIVWKNSKQTVLVLNITEAKQHPLPEIGEVTRWHTTYGGVSMEHHKAESARNGVKRRDAFIQNLIIEKTKDDPIPRVLKGATIPRVIKD